MMQQGGVVWLTGIPCAGKSTIAALLSDAVRRRHGAVRVFDGDELRRTVSRHLDFSPEARGEQARRAATYAADAASEGILAIVALVSPARAARAAAAGIVGEHFVEVHVDAPRALCEDRDVKGMYALARAGRLQRFTGVSAPYEPPLDPALRLDTSAETPELSAERLCRHLERYPWTPFHRTAAPVPSAS